MTTFLCEGFVERAETEATRAASSESYDDVSSNNSGSDNEGDMFDGEDFDDDRDRSDSARQSLLVDQLFSQYVNKIANEYPQMDYRQSKTAPELLLNSVQMRETEV